MKLIESFIKGKISDSECEDNYFFGKNYAAVIDGATSSGNININNKKGGKYLSDEILDIIEGLDGSVLASDKLILLINDKIKEGYKNNGLKDDYPSASAVIYNREFRELIFIGDCKALLIYQNNENHLIENNNELSKFVAEVRSRFLKMKFLSDPDFKINDISDDVGRKIALEFIQYQGVYENNSNFDFSYSTLNGFTADYKRVKITSDVKELVLASDGYHKLFNNLKETENYLSEILKEDPLMINIHKETKGFYGVGNSFDDRVYLRIKL